MKQITLSDKEKELILQLRAKEEADKPKKIGFLKEDLYVSHERKYEISNWYFNPDEFAAEIETFKNMFELAVPAGTQFDCFILENGSESWYDNSSYGIENMDAKWARKYLINIKNLSKKK